MSTHPLLGILIGALILGMCMATNLLYSDDSIGCQIGFGDFGGAQKSHGDDDTDVDEDDFLGWQKSFGVDDGADADGDGDSDGDDFLIWQTEFGSGSGSASAAVPEPSSWLMTAVGLALFLTKRTCPHRSYGVARGGRVCQRLLRA